MNVNLKEIRLGIDEIIDDKLYSPMEIKELGLVLNSKLEPSVYTLYRHIHADEVEAINLGTEKNPKYYIEGKELKRFLKERYKLNK